MISEVCQVLAGRMTKTPASFFRTLQKESSEKNHIFRIFAQTHIRNMKRPIPIAYRPDISEYEYLFDYYYSKCPGSVLPFLLLYLAKENQVKVLGK